MELKILKVKGKKWEGTFHTELTYLCKDNAERYECMLQGITSANKYKLVFSRVDV